MLRSPLDYTMMPGTQSGPVTRNSYLDTVLSPPQQPCLYSGSASPMQKASPVASATESVVHTSCHGETRSVKSSSKRLPTLAEFKGDNASVADGAFAKNFNIPSGNDSLGSFSIDCNSCGELIPDEHYHCGICDNGDFDLCLACVAAEITCNGSSHWLIKRKIQNGCLVTSVTERINPKKWQPSVSDINDIKTLPSVLTTSRTCNSCIRGT